MTSSPPDHDRDDEALAGTYVLGALEPWEKAAIEARLLADEPLRAAVRGWERRLAPLADLAAPARVPDALWQRIARSIGPVTIAEAAPRDQAPAGTPPAPGQAAPPVLLPAEPVTPATPLAPARSAMAAVRRWRAATMATGMALAASLAVVAVTLPAWLAAQRDDGRYLGLVNTGGAMPALVVEIDTRRGEVMIRPLGPAAPAGRSHELWAVRGNDPPVSLGLVDASGVHALPRASTALLGDPAVILAVSEEPAGGSPTGKPTGPVVLTGRLFKAPK